MSKPTVSAAGGAMPAEGHKPETYASRFLRLMARRQSIERTLGEMAALLDVDAPEATISMLQLKQPRRGIPIAVRAGARSHQRREA